MAQRAESISVVLCTYSEERWNDLIAAVASVQRQTLRPEEIIVVIDHNLNLLRQAREFIKDVIVLENWQGKGASGARNSGVAIAQGDVVAFLDDDACADPYWLERMSECFSDPQVVGVGGKINPIWPNLQPCWFPKEFKWVVGCTYEGMPEENSAVRNLICANMAVRRQTLLTVGGFRSSFGNNKESSVHQKLMLFHHHAGDEETELCIRISQKLPGRIWLYAPAVSVEHRVPIQRVSLRYFLYRCYDEGLGKAMLVRLHGSSKGLAAERTYTLRTLPEGVLHGVIDAFLHRDLAGLARVAAILLGLAVTIAGYLVGKIFRSSMVPDLQLSIATANVTGVYEHNTTSSSQEGDR